MTSTNLIKRNGLKYSASALALTLAVGFSVEASAQLDEIVVTAQKREQSIQDVPASVSAFSSETVNTFLGGGVDIRALTGRAPSLIVETSNGRQSPRFYIRGLGNTDFDVNANQPVSVLFDEIPLENSILKSLPVFDIERVEVLAGPQGTLFGRNTTAGIVKFESVKPSFDPSGYIGGGYGSRNTRTVEGAIGGGLTDKLAARASFKYVGRGDWIDNPTLGTDGDDHGAFDEFAYRVQLLYQPSDVFSSELKIHGFHQAGDTLANFYAGALEAGREGVRPGFDPAIAFWDSEPEAQINHWGGRLKMDWDIGNSVQLTSISGYDSLNSFNRGDVDGGRIGGPGEIGDLGVNAFFGVETGDGLSDHYQFSQEVRASGELNSVFYQLGFYYFNEDITIDSESYAVPGSARTDLTQVNQQTRSIAVFGHVDYDITDQFTLGAGLRFTDDSKDLRVVPGPGSTAPANTVQLSDDYVNWDVSATYAYNDDISVYGRIGNASRGPVTIGRFGFVDTADTETLTSYEVGWKSNWFDGRARWNAAAFYYTIDDQQLTATGGAANTNSLLNADKTVGKGFESDIQVLFTENLRVNTNFSYTDTEIQDSTLGTELCGSTPSCTGLDPVTGMSVGPFGPITTVSIDGNSLPRAPKWLFNVDAHYGVPLDTGTIYFQTDWNYRGSSSIFFYDSVEFVADARWIGGVRVGFEGADGRYDIAFVGRNIADKIAVDGALDFLNLTAFVNEPRFFGFEARWNFF